MTTTTSTHRIPPIRRASMTPSVNQINGHWRAMIGNYQNAKGETKPKAHYFGRVDEVPEAEAQRTARVFKAFYDSMSATGRTIWTDADLTAAARFAAADATDPRAEAEA